MLTLTLLVASCLTPPAAAESGPSFPREIAPLLQDHCLRCHSGNRPKGDLDLSSTTGLQTGGAHGPVVEPGKAADSLLFRHVRDKKMPPKEPLDAAQVELLRRWIDAGAKWEGPTLTVAQRDVERRAGPDWWSLLPVRWPRLPAVSDPAWVRTPVDAYILARLDRHKLRPSPEADRRTYIRRLTVDLLGLLPTPEEADAFVHDSAADASEKLVDRLLASPHYGERWGRHWLDVVRFAESHGYEMNTLRTSAWPYRDYVITALNEDRPFARFVREQLAGEADADPLTQAATGFLVGGTHDMVGNATPEGKLQQRADDLYDMVSATGAAFLGLTVHCARCHDHKFDPIAQRDYYGLQAVFAGVQHAERPIPVSDSEPRRREAERVRAQLAAIRREIGAVELVLGLASVPRRTPADARRNLEQQKELQARLTVLEKPELVYAGTFQKPAPTHLLNRGDPLQRGEEVGPAAVGTLGRPLGIDAQAPERDRRLALAEWLGAPENPLPARVLVNRLWHYHFGQGLVRTPSDFGFNGDRPSHPELLDWLAIEFQANGGRLKPLHRLLVLSSTYRQASELRPEAQAADADNRLLWRFTPRRLEAEALRDALLQISGGLNRRMGGPGYHLWEYSGYVILFTPKARLGPDEFRRMVYQFKPRTQQDETFGAFDCPDATQAMPRRNVSTTAIQALNLLNGPFVAEQCERFAERLREEAGQDPAAQVRRAFLLAFGRKPSAHETAAAAALVREHGPAALSRALLNANEFVYVD